MAVGFGTVTFSVFTSSDGTLPMPVQPANENSPRTYDADIRINDDDLTDLRALRSIVTFAPAMGFILGGTLIVEAGAGSRELTYPIAEGVEITRDAILVFVEPTARLLQDEYTVAVSFFIVDS